MSGNHNADKKRSVISFRLIIIAVIAALFAAAAVMAVMLMSGTKARDITLTLLRDGERESAVSLFRLNTLSAAPIKVEAGGVYTLSLKNTYPTPVHIEILTEGCTHRITENDIKLPAGGETVLTVNAEESGTVALSYALSMEGSDKRYFASSAAPLTDFISRGDIRGKTLTLLSDITAETLSPCFPFTLDFDGHTLDITAELSASSRESGVMVFKNAGDKLHADVIYLDTPLWEVTFELLPAPLTGRGAPYHVNAASLNGQPVDRGRLVVGSPGQWLRLMDDKLFPSLEAGMTVVFDGEYSLKSPENPGWFAIGVPISLEFGQGVDITDALFLVETYEKGSVNIVLRDPPSRCIQVEAPLCALTWSGSGAPDESDVFETMNVASYNGKAADKRMGGTGRERLLSVSLVKKDNKGLLENLVWETDGNIITCYLDYTFPESLLKGARPVAKVTGGKADFSGTSPEGTVDLRGETACVVTDGDGRTRSYLIRAVWRKYNLPVVTITTSSGKKITSKTQYTAGSVSVVAPDGVDAPPSGSLSMQIRGRGNSTWTWPKKPYRIKLDKKHSLLGMAAARDWVLLANYADKSLIRNHVALTMGKQLPGLAFVPSSKPVDVFVNGVYQGVYSLGEHIEVHSGRVNITKSDDDDTGYLLEIGGTDDGVHVHGKDFFHAGTLRYVLVHASDTAGFAPSQFAFIREYVTKADRAVTSLSGYEEYIDIPSLIDWFLLHELTYNLDSSFRRSCFITKDAGGKLRMGPPWDFDLALGNLRRDNQQYNDWACVGTDDKDAYVKITWMNYLLKDPNFTTRLRKRWNEVGGKMLSAGLECIRESRAALSPSAVQNFRVWNILGKRAAFESVKNAYFKTHGEHLDYIENFLKNRKAWMDKTIGAF